MKLESIQLICKKVIIRLILKNIKNSKLEKYRTPIFKDLIQVEKQNTNK